MELNISDLDVRMAVYESFSGKCFYTGRDLLFDDFHIDHFIPKSKGGEDSFNNYVLCCANINIAKSDKLDSKEQHFSGTQYILGAVFSPKAEGIYVKLKTKKKRSKPFRKRKEEKVRKLKIKLKSNLKRLAVTERIINKYLKESDVKEDSFTLDFSDLPENSIGKYKDYVFKERGLVYESGGSWITTKCTTLTPTTFNFDGFYIKEEKFYEAVATFDNREIEGYYLSLINNFKYKVEF